MRPAALCQAAPGAAPPRPPRMRARATLVFALPPPAAVLRLALA